MNSLIIAVLACLAVASAAPSGHGIILKGPSGIITGAGPIGPSGEHAGGGHGDDGWDGDDGSYHGDGGWHSGVVSAHGATIIAPSAGHAVVAGPAHGGWAGAGWGGHGGWGGHSAWGGWGAGAGVSIGHHGVSVHGPHTVPAVVSGPAGKIVADGLYGIPHHGHHW